MTTDSRRQPTLRVALVTGLVLVAVLVSLCAWLGYRAHQARQAEQFQDRLVRVAKQSAIDLTSIDYEHADADIQRILDSSTGAFYDDFKSRSGSLVDVVKKVRSKSVGAVTEAGLESISGREGKVLLAVAVSTTKGGAPDGQPRHWRMRVTVSGSGPDVKVSKVDFVA